MSKMEAYDIAEALGDKLEEKDSRMHWRDKVSEAQAATDLPTRH